MSRRPVRAPLIACLVLLALVAVAAALLIPWQVLPTGAPPLNPAVARDFTESQVAREAAFHADVRPWSYAGLVLALVVSLVLGFSPLGGVIVRRSGRVVGGSWPLTVVAGVFALTLIGVLVTLPLQARVEVGLRRFGLSTQGWGGWLSDRAKGWVITAVVASIALLALVGLARALPRWWWAIGATGAAALVVVASFAYPLLIEPVFNRFTPMPASALRSELLALAARDGVPVQQVLVADASRRTTATNAYVSGFGSTRRIVVYDTLLRAATPQEVVSVVAHELGHAKRGDVLRGTALGALGAAAAVCAVGVLLTWGGLLRRAGVSGAADPRVIALLLALAALGTQLSAPISNLMSRRIEAHADLHALQLTRDPTTFAQMQRGLALTNLDDLTPAWWQTLLFSNHPSTPERIAMARSFAQANALPPVPDLAALSPR